MENKFFNKKTIVVAIFILVSAITTYVGFNEVFAQSSGNQSATTASGNQSQFIKHAETLKKFENLTGSNQKFFTNDKSISNPNNTLGNSLATNKYQSY
ncbi:MAG: hypothetical protein ABJB76_07925 [Candidatus Nitrosocosmicus sp.]